MKLRLSGERAGMPAEAIVTVKNQYENGDYWVDYNGKSAHLTTGGTLSRMNGTRYRGLMTACSIEKV